MTGFHLDNRAAGQRVVRMVALLLIGMLVAMPGVSLAAPGNSSAGQPVAAQATDIPSRNPNPSVRIEDATGILNAQQFQILNADLDRLARLGTESVIFVRDSADESTAQSYLADDLRIAWGVESSVGARDGLVLVVSVDRTDPSHSTIVTSAGLHTFPLRQLSADGFAHLTDAVALPQIQQGDVFGGLRDLVEFTLGTVIDRTGTLSERQITTLDGDLRRLDKLGLPTLVYIRSSDDDSGTDETFAAALLETWQTDTAENDTNQMVVVVTVNTEDPGASTIAYVAGPDAFPIRQLAAEGYQAILDDQALPALQEGDVYLSLAYAVRKAINYAEYSPPNPAPLNEVQDFFQQPLNLLAAVLVQAGFLLYVLVPATLDRRLTLVPSPRAMATYTIITSILAVVVGIAGVLDRNRAAALAGLGVFLLATVVLPLMRAGFLAFQRRLPTDQTKPQPAEEVARVI